MACSRRPEWCDWSWTLPASFPRRGARSAFCFDESRSLLKWTFKKNWVGFAMSSMTACPRTTETANPPCTGMHALIRSGRFEDEFTVALTCGWSQPEGEPNRRLTVSRALLLRLKPRTQNLAPLSQLSQARARHRRLRPPAPVGWAGCCPWPLGGAASSERPTLLAAFHRRPGNICPGHRAGALPQPLNASRPEG